jgi:hypothetical protein
MRDEGKEICIKLYSENLERQDHLGNLVTDGLIIWKLFLKHSI